MRLALLGDPVAHSLSPRFQGAALAALGIAGSYEAIRCERADLEATLARLGEEGFRGVNLTVPLKEAAYALLAGRAEAVAPDAHSLSAVNTLRREAGGRWSLHNTDVAGAAAAIHLLLDGELTGLSVLLIGAGGAARAVAQACLVGGARRVSIWNRGPRRRDALLSALSKGDDRLRGAALSAGACPPGHDLLVQCTSLGLGPEDPLPPLPAPGEKPAALDLVTHTTAWQGECADRGCKVADGREMLLAQGAAALTLWTGLPAPLPAMRAALAD